MKKYILLFLVILLFGCEKNISKSQIEEIISKSTSDLSDNIYEDQLVTNNVTTYSFTFSFDKSVEIYGWIFDNNLSSTNPFTLDFTNNIIRYAGTENNFTCRVKLNNLEIIHENVIDTMSRTTMSDCSENEINDINYIYDYVNSYLADRFDLSIDDFINASS